MKANEAKGLNVKAGVKAGGLYSKNHSGRAIRVNSGIKAGAGIYHKNHTRPWS